MATDAVETQKLMDMKHLLKLKDLKQIGMKTIITNM